MSRAASSPLSVMDLVPVSPPTVDHRKAASCRTIHLVVNKGCYFLLNGVLQTIYPAHSNLQVTHAMSETLCPVRREVPRSTKQEDLGPHGLLPHASLRLGVKADAKAYAASRGDELESLIAGNAILAIMCKFSRVAPCGAAKK